jgi:uncharacterized protein YjlB
LLVYPGAVNDITAEAFEELFTRNRWPAAWLPAETGHKKVSSRGALGVVGAYPEGQHPDTCRLGNKNFEAIARVPLPACDPVYGPGGPLFTYWLRPSDR